MASRGTEFQVALEKLGGFGKFHYLLLMKMLPSSASGVLVVNTITYEIPALICDFGITKYQSSLIFCAVYIGPYPALYVLGFKPCIQSTCILCGLSGMIFGGLIWGVMSDIIGRKVTLLILLATVFIFETAASMAQGYWQLFLFKVCSGFMGAGIMTTSYTYVSEFTEDRYKDKITMGIGMITAIGYFLQPIIAIFTIPIGTGNPDIIPGLFALDGWRIFQVIGNMFPLAGFFTFLLILDESPAFLLQINRSAAALNILKKVYAINTGKPPETYEVKDVYLDEGPTDQPEKSSFLHQIKLLFYGKYTITVIVVILCQVITMGAFGAIRSHLAIIITVSLGIGQKEGGSNEKTFCELFKNQSVYTDEPDCKTNKIKLTEEIYIYTTIIGFCIFVSFIPVGALVRKIGKQVSYLILHGVGGSSLIFLPFVRAYGVLFFLIVYAITMQNCITITVGFILNRIPTSIRGLAVAVILIGGRMGVILGSLIYPTMTKISTCVVGFWTIAGLNTATFPLIWFYSTLRNPMEYSKPDQSRKNDD